VFVHPSVFEVLIAYRATLTILLAYQLQNQSRRWQLLQLVSLLYVAVIVPLRIAFTDVLDSGGGGGVGASSAAFVLYNTELLLDVVAAVDAWLRATRFAPLPGTEEGDDDAAVTAGGGGKRAAIRRHYRRSWRCLFDALALLPFDLLRLFVPTSVATSASFLGWVRANRLLRVCFAPEGFAHARAYAQESDGVVGSDAVRLVQVSCVCRCVFF
jgi:hypothetical protein